MITQSKSWRRAVYACISLIVITNFPVVAQKKSSTVKQWSQRAQSLTDSIIIDSVALASLDRALLFGRLGEAWWKNDPERARGWMKKAVQELEYAPSSEVEARRAKLSTARVLLTIVASRDRVLSIRLSKMFVADSEKTSDNERQQNSDALLEAALAVVDSDPERAATLGSAALGNGPSGQLIDLLASLSARDAKLGEALFSQALTLASLSSDQSLFLQLGQMAFPNGQNEPSNSVSVEARTQLLMSLAQAFLSRPIEPGQPGNCRLAWIVAPLLGPYSQLLPQQAPLLREALGRCQTRLDSLARERVNEVVNDKPLKGVDDFLQAGERAADTKVRSFHLARAASLVAKERDYDRAIRILETIGAGEREMMNGAWKAMRAEWAAKSALTHAKAGNYATMRKVIADTPTDLRSFTLIDVAMNLADTGDRILATELAYETRRTLERATLSRVQEVNINITLVQLFAKLAAFEAPQVLLEMVTSMNRTAEPEEASAERFGTDPSNVQLIVPISLPAFLLEIDSLGVQQTVASIAPPKDRVRVRLGLLSGLLEKMRPASIIQKQVPSREASKLDVNR